MYGPDCIPIRHIVVDKIYTNQAVRNNDTWTPCSAIEIRYTNLLYFSFPLECLC